MSDIGVKYERRRSLFLEPVAQALEVHLQSLLTGCERIDRVCSRAKSTERFLKKAAKVEEDGSLKYTDPLAQIQDQVGARVVTFYLADVRIVSDLVKRYMRPVENKVIIPEKEKEFGYIGEHFILFLPDDVTAAFQEIEDKTRFFELQIKTLFQHAWSEAEHDLGYKAPAPLTSIQKRKMAFTAAQAWGADHIFDELNGELVQQTT
jgi:putative GTP pyrophosphokinase